MAKMNLNGIKAYWLSTLIALFGLISSLALWYFFRNGLQTWWEIMRDYKDYLPWAALVFGLSFTFLIAALVRINQLAKSQAIALQQSNAILKSEINDRINAEETKQKLEIALLQGQKLQAMGTLAGGIAHDFNNLLYAIIGYTEITREDEQKDTQIYKNLGKILEACQRGQDLIARILAFSRRQQHHFDPLDLRKTIEAALSLLRPTIPASVTIDFEPVEATVYANQTQLHQVLVNIINNAVDAMDGEGEIHITLSHVLPDDPLLKQFPDTIRQNYCKISIVDTGHGMDQSTMERIFEPFYTTKAVGKGTGLGLSIVHSIIKEHQGEITVQSQLGRGTTFTILLPEQAKEK